MEILPIFPLQLVAFPGQNLNLHIFEPRYKQLLTDVEHKGTSFLIPTFFKEQSLDYASEVRLQKIHKKYDDGKLDIKTHIVGVYRIIKILQPYPGRLYDGAEAEKQPITAQPDVVKSAQILELVEKVYRIMEIKKAVPNLQDQFFSFRIGHHVGLSLDQEYELLKIKKESDRQEFIVEHLTKLIPILNEMENLRKKIQLNGHFKNLIPPQI